MLESASNICSETFLLQFKLITSCPLLHGPRECLKTVLSVKNFYIIEECYHAYLS